MRHRGMEGVTSPTDSKMTGKNKARNNRNGKKKVRGADRGMVLYTKPPLTSVRMNMAWSESFSIIETVAGGGVTRAFRINSPYDPDSAVLTRVPVYWTPMTQMYSEFRVHRARVWLEGVVTDFSPSAGKACCVTVVPAVFPAMPSNPSCWPTQPNAISQVIALLAGKNVFHSDKTFDLAKDVFAIRKSEFLNSMDFTGTVGSNPPRLALYWVNIQGLGSPAVMQFAAMIRIAYDVEFFNPVLRET